MNGTTHLKIGDINKNLICILCGGYYIDATTIIECLHSFCRTCIVTYLKTSKTCPLCDTMVHKTRPHQNIRSDKLLQDLVYKLVPGLYRDEMKRRREFYTRHYDAAPKRPGEERGDEMSDRFAYTEEEKISLALHFCREGSSERVDFRRVFTSKEDIKARVEKRIKEAVDVRYLQCKAAVTIGHLKKFVRLKYGLPSHFQVEIFYNDEPLRNSCTLCDITYFFSWMRRAPLVLTFCVYETTRKHLLGKDSLMMSSSTSAKSQSATTTVTTFTSGSEVSLTAEKATVPPYSLSVKPTATPTPTSSTLNSIGADRSLSTKPAKSKLPRPRKSTKGSVSKSSLKSTQSSLENAAPSRQTTKTKSTCLGKRPASSPIPIAPAPAKILATNPSVLDITKFINTDSKDQKTFSSPKLVSLLPSSTGSEKTSPRITFSMSSILKAVTSKNGTTCYSQNSTPDLLNVSQTPALSPIPMTLVAPTFPVYLSSPSPATRTSSCQAVSVKSESVTSVKTSLPAHNVYSKQMLTSSLSLSSSSSPTTLSSSMSSATVTDAQSAHNSIGSPTPASSASPTPAAVPVQQSQTQGSDTHTNLSTNQTVTDTQPLSVSTCLTTPLCQRDSGQVCSYAKKIPELQRAETCNTHISSARRNTSNADQGISSLNPKDKSEINYVPASSSTITSSMDSSLSDSMSSGISCDFTPNNSGMSPAANPTSNETSVSCSMRKHCKQKKIADIANTLHKRVNDALLQMNSKRSCSPNSRRSPQCTPPGKKASNIPLATHDRDTPVAQQNRQGLHNFHLSGHLLNTTVSLESAHNSQADEPLNLVKGDRIVRQTNGKFILEVPQTSK